jgi:dTDP-4-amino-4,6-dideoxygalactose transaminase
MRGNLVCPLSELQAAVLLPQLESLDCRNQQRAQAAAYLRQQLEALPGVRFFAADLQDSQPGFYKAGLFLDEDRFGLPRALLVRALRAEGIAVDEGFAALHVGRSPRRFRQAGPLHQAEHAHRQVIILHHPVLLGTRAELDQVAAAFRKVHDHRERLTALTT